MSHTAKVSSVESRKEPLIIVCEQCGRETSHSVRCGMESHDSSPDGDIHGTDKYLVVQCMGCKTLSFCQESWNSEDFDVGSGEFIISRSLYPQRIIGRPLLDDRWFLPQQIREVYEQTRAAIIQNLPILAGIGVRAIIETVCKEQNATGRNLAERIDALATLQLIARREALVLHSLRFMGNAAAHETKAHSTAELNASLNIVEHLLNTVYLLERQQRRLQKELSCSRETDELDLE
jgi:hypothetical protein